MAEPARRTTPSHRAIVAGVDEAGRGPLAGPVIAAAVVLDDSRPIDGLRDSKQLSSRQRRILARLIRQRAVCFAVALASHVEIDEKNILQATLLAMKRAVERLPTTPTHVRVDGNRSFRSDDEPLRYEIETVVRGDQTVAAISAASILAKVCRDRLMLRWHRTYPAYGFNSNKGYPTRLHLRALEELGPSPIHRCSFAPVLRAQERLAG
ncbi:MAG: ribonuclease HII [Gammaproteobacteria bacterium]